MRGGRYAKISVICVVIAAILRGIFVLDSTEAGRLGGVWRQVSANFRCDFPVAEGIKLYAEPDNRGTDDEARFDENGPFVRDYQEIKQTRAVVIIFGAEWCQWCKAQAKELTEPSKTYNIVYADVENEDGSESRWGVLAKHWELGSSIPVTVIVENGKLVEKISGYVDWEAIQPKAEKAKKNERESQTDFVVGPLDGSRFGDVDLSNRRRNRMWF